ncbi:erythrocyte membrane protein [Babesia caballi]|uniref:Erythrocyte membrane protein n=1 Tax=Babesia caballi TaxID=5871 RepID=A0AAV4LVN9_BABCB|nr:erythrocyte membrane protein [Babesia caballi]
MRYRGEIDENELPHGYGEWLEDDGYGERLQGYWWHGYPIGPFTSQEIGSGSIFANTRVAFITDTRKESGKVRYGVSSTECSMSGNFFREFPLTYFFNPLYNDKHHYNPGGFYKNCKFFNVLHDRFADLQGASFKWCVRMLRSQFFLNMPTNASTITVYVDKLSKSLRLNGYKQTGDASETKSCDEIRIKLTTQKGGGMLTRLNQINENVNQTTGAAESVSSSSLSNDECEEDKESGDGNPAKLNSLSSGFLKVNNNRGLLNVPHPVRGRDGISRLFLDEDDWEDQVNSSAPQFLVEGWAPIRSFGKIGCIADQAVIYIHGYNVSLQEACSQMAHIVAFSKLPPYVLPFVFNWDGQHWGRFGALAYRKARNITQHPGLEESFCELLNELGNMGIKHLHIIAHSCGARVFFKVFRAAIQKKLLLQVLGSNKPTFDGKQGQIGSTKTTSSTPIRIDTLMLLNPDFPMKKFRDHDYFVVRSYCDHIVMYVDTRDHCLTMAELHNGEESLGMSVFGMCTTPEILDEVVPELEAAGISLSLPKNQMAAEIAFLSNYTMYKSKATLARPSHLDGGVFSIDMPSGEGSSAVKRETVSNSVISPSPIDVLYNTMSKSSEVMQSYNLPRLSDDLGVESRHLWLDMDVIDTTMIDTNVDFLKHSLYQMKREIMDDLREVILMKIRADQRHTRLDRRRGNVFVFRVAPAAVNHLFRGP